MEDLLNEEEFIKPEKYNPWKHFFMFYGINVVLLILINIFSNLIGDNYRTLAPLFGLIKLSIPFIMIFSKKENCFTSYKNIVLGISIILIINYVAYISQVYYSLKNPLIPKSLVSYSAYTELPNFLIRSIITIGIILLVVKFIRRKPIKKNAGLT